ncbi:hypothetical protein AB0M28_32800 [Streptomyces sp. NPDC051940]|uniref:hypothetical protein n=1 Tax=Streptomyces sp. NPDC051940 TaxID=3155675 RepID=UPI0034297489
MHSASTALSAVRHRITGVRVEKETLVVTGYAYADGTPNERAGFQAELRNRSTARTYRLSVSRTATPQLVSESGQACPDSGFDLVLNAKELAEGAQLPAGVWDLYLTLAVGDSENTVRIGAERAPEVSGDAVSYGIGSKDNATCVVGFFDSEDGGFSVDMGGGLHPEHAMSAVPVSATWQRGGDAVMLIKFSALPGVDPSTVSVHAVNEAGERIPAQMNREGKGVISGTLRFASSGEWRVLHTLNSGDSPEGNSVRAGKLPAPTRWRRGLAPWYAKPYSAKNGGLTVRVAKVDVIGAVKRAARGAR